MGALVHGVRASPETAGVQAPHILGYPAEVTGPNATLFEAWAHDTSASRKFAVGADGKLYSAALTVGAILSAVTGGVSGVLRLDALAIGTPGQTLQVNGAGTGPEWVTGAAPSAHALVGGDHTVSGLTTGHVLQATGATTFAFGSLLEAQVTQHQAVLSISETQIPDGTLLARVGSAETVAAIWAFNGGTSGVSAPFTVDSTFLVSNLNADLLDGNEASAFALASHTHAYTDVTFSGLAAGQLWMASGASAASFTTNLTGNYTLSAAGTALAITPGNLSVAGTVTASDTVTFNKGGGTAGNLVLGNSGDASAWSVKANRSLGFDTTVGMSFYTNHSVSGSQIVMALRRSDVLFPLAAEVTGNLTVGGTATVTSTLFPANLIQFNGGNTDYRVEAATADASDSKRLVIGGGGQAGLSSRGGYMTLAGNEHADLGGININAGAGGGSVAFGIAGTEAGRFNASRNLVLGTTTAATGSPRLDVVGTNGLVGFSDIVTDASTKTFRLGVRHYTNTEEMGAVLLGQSTSGAINVIIGGGTSLFNAATSIQLYTAANNTTVTGTLRASWDSAGTFAQVGNATIGGTLGVTGLATFANDIILTPVSTTAEIRTDTADASDTARLGLTAGSALSNTRSALFIVHGNEHATNPGVAFITSGNVSGHKVQIQAAGSDAIVITRPSANLIAVTGDMTVSATLGTGALTATTISGTGALSINANAAHAIRRDVNGGTNVLALINQDATATTLHNARLIWELSTTAPAKVTAGAIQVGKLAEWTSVASTQDSSMLFQVAIDGALSTGLTLSTSAGVHAATLAGSLSAQAISGTTGTYTGLLKHNGVAGVVTANAALATTATDGFLYIPTAAGVPTGVPTTQTGTVALMYDTTNNDLYVYNGAWKKVTLA